MVLLLEYIISFICCFCFTNVLQNILNLTDMKIITYKIYFRASKSGMGALYLRITSDRIHRYISLNICVKADDWNEKKSIMKSTAQDCVKINRLLQGYVTRANNIIYDYSLKNRYLSADQFRELFLKNNNSTSFYVFVEKMIEDSNSILSSETIRGYRAQLTKMKDFRKTLAFDEIDSAFLITYEKYMIKERQNVPNTVSRSFKFIKSVITKAREQKITEINPFESKKISYTETMRSRLTIKEINRLEAYHRSEGINDKHKKVLTHFLFACYTGLRYSDIVHFKHSDIDDTIINIKMHKTGIYVRIPIIDKAKSLIPANKYKIKNLNVFTVMTNQHSNRVLKDVIKAAGIDKDISFHSARHTFATVGIDLGIPIEIISQLLGHTDVKVTRIYAKYSDQVKKEELKKWKE